MCVYFEVFLKNIMFGGFIIRRWRILASVRKASISFMGIDIYGEYTKSGGLLCYIPGELGRVVIATSLKRQQSV